ncbi:MAG: DUF302 domain-containing protein [Pseudomonadota bacterium]
MRRALIAALAAVALIVTAAPGTALAHDHGEAIVSKTSPHDVTTTLDRIAAAVEANGGKVFVRLDHAAAAEQYGESLRPTQVLIFGNPKVGTGLMDKKPALAIDLPLKVMAYAEGEGSVVVYRAPSTWALDHGLEKLANGAAGQLDKLTDHAIKPE